MGPYENLPCPETACPERNFTVNLDRTVLDGDADGVHIQLGEESEGEEIVGQMLPRQHFDCTSNF